MTAAASALPVELAPTRAAAAAAVDDEPALVERVRRGDAAAFDALVNRYMRRAFAVAYRLMGQKEDAEDLVQDAFMTVLQRIALRLRHPLDLGRDSADDGGIDPVRGLDLGAGHRRGAAPDTQTPGPGPVRALEKGMSLRDEFDFAEGCRP